jgi:protease-4
MDQQSPPPAYPPQPPAVQPAPPQPPAPPPQRGMSAGWKWAIGCGIAVVLAGFAAILIVIVGVISLVSSGVPRAARPMGNIALIRVEGAISAGAISGPFGGGASAEEITRQLHQAGEDRGIKAILIRVNSPGGSAAGSQEIYDEIRRVRDRKPVYCTMGDVAASGGYYVSCAADRIFADPGTITGSIGVISASIDLSGLLRKIGVEPQVVKEGKYKDMGSGLRPLTDQERRIMQSLLGNVYQQFVGAVADARKLPKATVVQLATGQVYTGQQALKLKLVDELGGMRPALQALAKRAGVSRPQVAEFRRRSLFDVLFGDIGAYQPQGARGILYDRVADAVTRGALRAEQ